MMRISVCCPSYKRPKVKTLNYIPYCKVYVAESEYDVYRKENPDAEIVTMPDKVQGNVARVRNYILDKEFEENDAVCMVDDDLYRLNRFVVEGNYGYKKEEITSDEFMDFLQKYTLLCEEFGYKLWGVNCNQDALSYRHCAPFSLSSIVLGPFGVHLKNDIRYDERLYLKEDYDIAIQHLNKYRGILRVNFVHYECLQSVNEGGCAASRNQKREKEQFELLQKKWGKKIVREDTSNKGKTAKIKVFDYNPIIKVPIKGI